MDRLIAERVPQQTPIAHFLSVFGGDAQVAAAQATISGQETFSVEGPELDALKVNMGKNAQCYRASLQLSASKRPLRHLVAVSEEFGAQVNASASGRTLLAGSSPEYLWLSVAQICGLPALPEWADWFYQKLCSNLAITELYGVGCQPVLVTASKEELLRWLSLGISKGEIRLPEQNGPATWQSIPIHRVLSAETAAPTEACPSLQ